MPMPNDALWLEPLAYLGIEELDEVGCVVYHLWQLIEGARQRKLPQRYNVYVELLQTKGEWDGGSLHHYLVRECVVDKSVSNPSELDYTAGKHVDNGEKKYDCGCKGLHNSIEHQHDNLGWESWTVKRWKDAPCFEACKRKFSELYPPNVHYPQSHRRFWGLNDNGVAGFIFGIRVSSTFHCRFKTNYGKCTHYELACNLTPTTACMEHIGELREELPLHGYHPKYHCHHLVVNQHTGTTYHFRRLNDQVDVIEWTAERKKAHRNPANATSVLCWKKRCFYYDSPIP